MTAWKDMTDKEFEEIERQSKKELREFKRNLKQKFPHLYKAIKQHEKEGEEPDVLMVDLYSSRFRNEVM